MRILPQKLILNRNNIVYKDWTKIELSNLEIRLLSQYNLILNTESEFISYIVLSIEKGIIKIISDSSNRLDYYITNNYKVMEPILLEFYRELLKKELITLETN